MMTMTLELLKNCCWKHEDTANYISDTAETTAIIGTGENSVSSTNKILEERKLFGMPI